MGNDVIEFSRIAIYGRKVTLNLSAKGIKTIDARGIESVVKDILARGEKI